MAKRENKVLVNFSAEEYNRLKLEADKTGLPLATLCRMIINKALKSEDV